MIRKSFALRGRARARRRYAFGKHIVKNDCIAVRTKITRINGLRGLKSKWLRRLEPAPNSRYAAII